MIIRATTWKEMEKALMNLENECEIHLDIERFPVNLKNGNKFYVIEHIATIKFI